MTHQDQSLSFWVADAYNLATSKGFGHETEDLYVARAIGLMHAELSELLECHRTNPKDLCDKSIPLMTCEEEEIADIFLRLANYCGVRGIDLGMAAKLKHEYNMTREHKHGKKF